MTTGWPRRNQCQKQNKIGKQSRGSSDGREGAAGLKKSLLNHPEPFVNTVTEKLLTYGLGRGLDYYDAPAVRAITREARNNGYNFSSLILGVVKSTPFQMRRSQ